jgi:hypothetical protein
MNQSKRTHLKSTNGWCDGSMLVSSFVGSATPEAVFKSASPVVLGLDSLTER